MAHGEGLSARETEEEKEAPWEAVNQ